MDDVDLAILDDGVCETPERDAASGAHPRSQASNNGYTSGDAEEAKAIPASLGDLLQSPLDPDLKSPVSCASRGSHGPRSEDEVLYEKLHELLLAYSDNDEDWANMTTYVLNLVRAGRDEAQLAYELEAFMEGQPDGQRVVSQRVAYQIRLLVQHWTN